MSSNAQAVPSVGLIIPARYQSSRFPGKPLVNILGKPMIQHVWEKCVQAVKRESVYIATDNQKIKDITEGFGGNVVMTSSDCLTGTDRIAEANEILGFDIVINVQGDEPIINPSDIKKVLKAYQSTPGTIVNAMSEISDESEYYSLTVPKVVVSKSNRLLFMSRSPLPCSKANEFTKAYKQVCIYAFSRDHLNFFMSAKKKTALEDIEDIEILRFVENDIPVKMVNVSSGSIAVDVPADVVKVIEKLI